MQQFMREVRKYIDVLANSCRSTIEQMIRIKVNHSEIRTALKEQGALPLAHIIKYVDYD